MISWNENVGIHKRNQKFYPIIDVGLKLVTPYQSILIYRRMKILEQQLPTIFFRVHLSFIININHISKIVDNHVYIANRAIPISNTYREDFLGLINKRSL